jgi:hypothetical protein
MKLLCWHALLALAFVGPGCLRAGNTIGPSPPGISARASVAAPATPAADPGEVRGAIQRAVVFLQRDGDWWMKGGKDVPGRGGCVSCHQVGFGLWSLQESGRAGLAVARDGIADLERRALAHFADRPSKAHAFTWGQLLLARARPPGDDGAGQPWREIPEKIAADQTTAGYWEAAGQFSSQKRPETESNAVVTMWVLLALAQSHQLGPRAVESRDRGWAWVRSQPAGVSTEWLLARLLLERHLGEAGAAAVWQAQVIESQRPDGGWRWLVAGDGQDPSNAFSTGQALYALARAGLGRDHAAIQRSVGYLLRTQKEDGTWSVPSQLVSNKGEEGGKIEYVYKYWATAWATMGLARLLIDTPGVRRNAWNARF